MKMLCALAGCLVLIGWASASAQPAGSTSTGYGIFMTSRLEQPQFMTIQVSGVPFCAGEISVTRPLQCPEVVQPPTMVKVVWGPTASFGEPATGTEALPAGWKSMTGPTQQQNLTRSQLNPPWWFRSGDVMVFTINRMHRLSITYQCNRAGHACVSYTPVTIFGRPQGVTPLAR